MITRASRAKIEGKIRAKLAYRLEIAESVKPEAAQEQPLPPKGVAYWLYAQQK